MITEVVERPSVTSYLFCSSLQKPESLSKPCLTTSCLSICPHSSKTSMVNWLALPSDSKQTLLSECDQNITLQSWKPINICSFPLKLMLCTTALHFTTHNCIACFTTIYRTKVWAETSSRMLLVWVRLYIKI